MLLFQKRFHSGLRDGSVTLTFRQWERPHVKPGGRYRCHPLGVLQVDAIDRVLLRDVTAQDAARAGFSSVDELRTYLARDSKALPDTTPLWRIALHHGGDGDRVSAALDDKLSDEDVAELTRKLDRMDDRSPGGPWTRKVLALIAKNPRIAASKLAPKLRRETLPFKKDVVKLKKLGLTQSFEVGYEVSPRGRAYLERAGKRRRPKATRSRR